MLQYIDLKDLGKYLFKRGGWLPMDELHWQCSNCGYVVGEMKEDCNYCPHCGARMDGKKIDNVDWEEE